jgi:hypothetical protein
VRAIQSVGEEKARERGAHGGGDHREEKRAAQDLVERAAVDRDEKHGRQGERVHELVERLARSLGDDLEAAGEVAARDQPEDRQHRAQNRI